MVDEIIQGAGEQFGITLTDSSGVTITPQTLASTGCIVDFYLAGVRKTYTKDSSGQEITGGGITWDSTNSKWIVTLSQTDTLGIKSGFQTIYLKVRFQNEVAPICLKKDIKIVENPNKAVIR